MDDEPEFIEEFTCAECGETFIAAKDADRRYCEVHRD